MLAIKLKMVGRKNQRTFRVIVQEASSKLDGKSVEDLGWYNPHTNQFKINKNRVDYWIGNGAQPTETVGRILKKAQTSEAETYPTREGRKKKKTSKVKDVETAGAKAEVTEVQAETAETSEEEVGDQVDNISEMRQDPDVGPQIFETPVPPEEENKEEAPAEESKEPVEDKEKSK